MNFPRLLSGSDRVRVALVVAGIAWLAILIGGFALLAHEEFTPVAAASVSMNFPAESSLRLAANESTLFLFVHPQCPCSHASLRELDGFLARTQSKAAVVIVFTIPKGVAPGWEQGDLWTMAAKMPGVRVVRDFGGVEAQRFGVHGSGHALLYTASGKMLFSGGITGSRGHEGDNPGCDAIADLVLTGHAAVNHTPVFGCSLL